MLTWLTFFPFRNDSRIATIKCRVDGTLLTLDKVRHILKECHAPPLTLSIISSELTQIVERGFDGSITRAEGGGEGLYLEGGEVL